MHFVGMETSHSFLSWNMEQFFKMGHATSKKYLALGLLSSNPLEFPTTSFAVRRVEKFEIHSLIYFKVSAIMQWHLALQSYSISFREKRIFMKGKPLQVNCVQLAPFLKLYKRSPIQRCSCVQKKTKVSFHCIQNNLFKSQAKPEIYHAKMFLAQAEKLITDLVLIGTGQSNT